MGRAAETPKKMRAEVRRRLEELIDGLINSIQIDDLINSQKIKMLQLALQYTLPRLSSLCTRKSGRGYTIICRLIFYFSSMCNTLKINFLDHVAISVSNIKKSVEWYEEVIGLKKHIIPEWGDYPIMMLAGKTGLAIFPANSIEYKSQKTLDDIRIKHFAFNVDETNFELAKERFKSLEIPFSLQDHHYFNSIYLKDLDGHEVELTSLKGGFENFYEY